MEGKASGSRRAEIAHLPESSCLNGQVQERDLSRLTVVNFLRDFFLRASLGPLVNRHITKLGGLREAGA